VLLPAITNTGATALSKVATMVTAAAPLNVTFGTPVPAGNVRSLFTGESTAFNFLQRFWALLIRATTQLTATLQ